MGCKGSLVRVQSPRLVKFEKGAGFGPLFYFGQMATFYILFSYTLDRYYIGHTTQAMDERLRKHLADQSHWTARAKDWKVVYSESHPDKAQAYRREREVKAWKSHKRIQELIRAAR